MLDFHVAKSFFFDADRVKRAVKPARLRWLSRAGAFIRTRARSSIRQRKRASLPGQPPSSHTGILKRFLFFAYDPRRDSVVIGPVVTNQVFFTRNSVPIKGTVPEVLEYGGGIRVMEVNRGGEWVKADLRSRRRLAGMQTRIRRVPIQARPYMGPAMREELPKLPPLWANSIRPTLGLGAPINPAPQTAAA